MTVVRRRAMVVAMSVIASVSSGCGWRLQGAARLPEPNLAVYLDTDNAYSDFYRELRALLVASGAKLQAQSTTAKAVVHIKSDQTGQRVASVSALNKPEQYEVFYSLEYSVDVSGQEAIPVQQVEQTASYSYDQTAVLAKQREQFSMQQALARELAGQVLRRLVSVSANSAPVAR